VEHDVNYSLASPTYRWFGTAWPGCSVSGGATMVAVMLCLVYNLSGKLLVHPCDLWFCDTTDVVIPIPALSFFLNVLSSWQCFLLVQGYPGGLDGCQPIAASNLMHHLEGSWQALGSLCIVWAIYLLTGASFSSYVLTWLKCKKIYLFS
jgi:hypothetical protein